MNIRASMLPAYNDCPRRAAARQWRRAIEEAGFQLREERPSIGAAVGTATHAVVEDYFRARMDAQEFDIKQSVDKAMEALLVETASGCIWDDTTSNTDTARYQIDRMSHIYILEVGAYLTPLAVEISAAASLGDDWRLTGRIDLVAAYGAGQVSINDLKTGAISRSHHAQLGAYSLLYRTCPPTGLPALVGEARIDFIKRTPRTRTQNGAVITPYPVALCERTAMATINRCKRDMSEFQKSGNPEAFAENPMSMLCNATYCIAHCTDFCPITKNI